MGNGRCEYTDCNNSSSGKGVVALRTASERMAWVTRGVYIRSDVLEANLLVDDNCNMDEVGSVVYVRPLSRHQLANGGHSSVLQPCKKPNLLLQLVDESTR